MQGQVTDYQEGMRLKDPVRAAAGMRMLQSLEGSNLELMAQMFGQDLSLSDLNLYFLEFVQPLDTTGFNHPLCKVNASLLTALAAGDAKAVSSALVQMGKIEDDDLKILATMIEKADENHCLRFVQRRTGPSVDPLSIKARWFMIYSKFKKIPAYKETGEKKLRKELIGDALDSLKSTTEVSRSLLYEILKYFNHSKK
jgi:hypothetical protein